VASTTIETNPWVNAQDAYGSRVTLYVCGIRCTENHHHPNMPTLNSLDLGQKDKCPVCEVSLSGASLSEHLKAREAVGFVNSAGINPSKTEHSAADVNAGIAVYEMKDGQYKDEWRKYSSKAKLKTAKLNERNKTVSISSLCFPSG
jgi:hypothetical protein